MDLDQLLGIDASDPVQRLARELVVADEQLLDALIGVRKRCRLSQAEVGEKMGVTQSAIARIEGGERDPRLSTLRRYALAVGALVSHQVRPAAEQLVGEEAMRINFETLNHLFDIEGDTLSAWDKGLERYIGV